MLGDSQSCRFGDKRGFTLLELFIAMSVIAVLVGIGIALYPSVMESQRGNRAKADIAVIQVALEKYKTRFGTYPKRLGTDTDMEVHIFNSLNGKVTPDGNATQVEAMLNLSVLELENDSYPNFNDDTSSSWLTNRVVDPWGNPYLYRFDPDQHSYASWNSFRYVLFSEGEDGASTDVNGSGFYNPDGVNNEDNIHAE